MSLNISELRERVAAQFSDAEQVDDSVLRFTKTLNGSPYAVYYIDISQDLPQSQETLLKYQDRIIGRHYFEGRKSLQWSNYLFFITHIERLVVDEVLKAKKLIELDRNYARKFVISEEDLDSVLTSQVIAPSDATPHASILSFWTERLTEAGLDKAILSDDNLPTRLKLIESSHAAPTAKSKAQKRTMAIKTESFIRSLNLNSFRDYPHKRSFTFGKVNLVFGANGSGKTSLLEAIEFFYCGKNKRNPEARPPYELAAVFADGRSEIVKANRGLQVFRDRNLLWYGQPEGNTANLFKSFAQFNFLDTDAAVSLTDSTSRIEDDLSKLLVGPDASKIWRDIGLVFDAVVGKLRDYRKLETQINEELAPLEKQLMESSKLQQESDSIHIRLDEMIRRIGWNIDQVDKEKLATGLVESLSELVALTKQAIATDWTDSPVSINVMAKYCCDTEIKIKNVEPDIAHLEVLQKNRNNLDYKIDRYNEALSALEEVIRLLNAGVHTRYAERVKQQSTIDTFSDLLAGLDYHVMGVLSNYELDLEVSHYHEEALSKRSAAEALLNNTKEQYAKFTKLKNQSLILAQELRQLAFRIIESNHEPDECPLCHTQFETGGLSSKINIGVDKHIEKLGQPLLVKIQSQESTLRDATDIEVVWCCLKAFCERSGLTPNISLRLALTEAEIAKQAIVEAQDRLKALDIEMEALSLQGLSMERLELLSNKLSILGYPLVRFSREDADQFVLTIIEAIQSSSLILETERKAIEELRQNIFATLDIAEIEMHDLKNALACLKETLATTEKLLSLLNNFIKLYPWPRERAFAELIVEVESVRTVAADLQVALGREKQANATYSESIKRQEHLKTQLADLHVRIKRLKEVQATLNNLKTEHSLKGALDSALQENRSSIEAIFKSIHSPAEFQGLGSNWSTLVRKVDGKEAKLSEISTGQRAAFALSIFLAQNIQLKYAPPIILIDDPIAHVDDLNSLSFLDYLREIVLKGHRQVFFATADDKLASLFERKFDFLGEDEFRRFNLGRES